MAFLCYVNCRGTSDSEKFNTYLTIGKILTLVIIIIVAFTHFEISNMKPFVTPEYGSHGIVLAASLLFFGIVGFDFISTISEEAINGVRDVPLAMRDCVIISTSFYILIAISMCGMGLGRIGNYNPATAIADQFEAVGMEKMRLVIYICATIGITACCFTCLMGLVRILQSLANEGFLPELFSGKNSPNGISIKGSLIGVSVVIVIAVLKDLEEIANLISVTNLITYSFVSTCGLALRYRS